MKEVFRNADSALVGLYQSILEDAGIPTFVHNTSTQQMPVAGLLTAICPLPQFFPTLNVLNDEDYPEAMQLLLSPAAEDLMEWTCSACGETAPGNFTTCWKCQSGRPLSPLEA
jgi:Putative prokaryotic signal transducing protein